MVVEMFREDPEFAAEYLNQVLEDGSRSELLLAMRYLTVAFSGLAGIAQATRSNASALYRTFSKRGNPKARCRRGAPRGDGAAPGGHPDQTTAMSTVVLESTLTCPHCGHTKQESMPIDACQYFYECTLCKEVLRPLPDDCCVFCSYGTMKCPPVQASTLCCG